MSENKWVRRAFGNDVSVSSSAGKLPMTAGAGRRDADDGVYLTAIGQTIKGGRRRRKSQLDGQGHNFPTYLHTLALEPSVR